MNKVTKLTLQNFKKFRSFEVEFKPDLNMFIGDNEAGKSSILLALDLTISGSRNKVETIGLEHLFNIETIDEFLKSARLYTKLPELRVELFLNDLGNEFTDGKNNSDKKECNGIKLICKPSDEYSKVIAEILKDRNCLFPFEFYSIEFQTFAGHSFNSHNKCIKHILIDNSQVNSEYAMREYTKEIYYSHIKEPKEKFAHHHGYRTSKSDFKDKGLNDINSRLKTNGVENYSFGIRTSPKANLETDLTIYDGSIIIENKGKGKQCVIKTELALAKNANDLEVVLLEEPENHLSHLNTHRLIQKISDTDNKQIFIATHSDLISARLSLRNCILLNSNSNVPVKLLDLPESTAAFFIKAPDNNILQFILSSKVVLVEGDAEFILSETFFFKANNAGLKESGVHIISVDGTSFPRYLDLAKKLKIRTAVITDNDGNYEVNITERYSTYASPTIKVFSDPDDERSTFEFCIYQDNQNICDDLFSPGRRKLTVQQYMIQNKAEVAFQLLDKKQNNITPPQYIIDALKWIIEN